MFWARGALFLTLMAAPSVHAASDVRAKFDGVYEGAAMPVPAMGPAGCPTFTLSDVWITKGFFKKSVAAMGPVVEGFITDEGYVSAFLTRPGHQRSALDGRLEDGVLSAGFIESDSGCVWVVHLRRRL